MFHSEFTRQVASMRAHDTLVASRRRRLALDAAQKRRTEAEAAEAKRPRTVPVPAPVARPNC